MVVRKLLFILVFIGAAAGLYVARERWQMERSNNTVELTAEWTELRQLAAIFRVPTPRLLHEFHSAGITSVALQEQSTHQLVDDGQVFRPDPFTDTRVRDLIGESGSADSRRTLLAFPEPDLRDRVRRNLDERWGAERVHLASLGDMPALIVDGGWAQFRDIGVGLDPAALELAKKNGLAIVGRVRNYAGLTQEQMDWTVKDLKAHGAHAVIFYGDDVLGNPDMIPQAAQELLRNNLPWGSVEFGKQHGEDKLQKALGGQFIRVHTILTMELSNLTPDSAVDRFVKAVKERTMRLLYIHLLSSVMGSTLSDDSSFIHRIAAGIQDAGFELGSAEAMPEWHAPRVAQALIMIGLIAGAALLLVELLGEMPSILSAALGLLLLGLLAALFRSSTHLLAVQAGALLATLVFPTLSMVLARFQTETTSADTRVDGRAEPHGHGAALLRALCRLMGTSLFSLIGAVYVIGLLANTLFTSKTEQFEGIKPAIIVPIIAVAAIYWGRLLDSGSIAIRWYRLRDRIETLLAEPLSVGLLVLFGSAMVVLWVLVARSGNDSAVGATTFELKTRHILDGLLVARPRTKEFLVGNPALFLAFYAAARRWRKAVYALLVLGSIGQTSLVNTFCHIHTPLYIAFFHAVNGLWLGAILGWLAASVWNYCYLRLQTRSTPAVNRKNGRRGPSKANGQST